MKEIVNWLREIEHLAGEMYQQAASIFANDGRLKEFLEHTAEDEAWHYHVMGSAAEFLSSHDDFTPAIKVDKKTSDKIIKQISDISTGLDQKTLSRSALVEKIVELELSEWNDIFLYAVNFLKDKTSEFRYPAARMQAHVKEIEYYIETVEGQPQTLEKIKELPPIWIENILIVDDEEMITEIVKALLYRSGKIDTAYNGKDALKMMEEKYYKLIVTDIDMPIMDGLTFYKKAVGKYPALSKRFLFMTGDLSPDRRSFFDSNNLKYLSKPMGISDLREVAANIIMSK